MTAALAAGEPRLILLAGRNSADELRLRRSLKRMGLGNPLHVVPDGCSLIQYLETEGWVEQTGIKYLLRSGCVISLSSPLAFSLQPLALASVTYTGGYVLPGNTPGPGQTPLPDDLEQAAVEQAAFWFRSRDHAGLRTSWPYNGEYKMYASLDLLPQSPPPSAPIHASPSNYLSAFQHFPSHYSHSFHHSHVPISAFQRFRTLSHLLYRPYTNYLHLFAPMPSRSYGNSSYMRRLPRRGLFAGSVARPIELQGPINSGFNLLTL